MNNQSAVTKIAKFDKASFMTLRPVIDNAVKAALAPYGLEATLGGIKYGETSFKGTLEVSTLDDGRRSFEQLAGDGRTLKPEWFGKTFISKGEEYRIIGANSGRKFNVETIRLRDQKSFSFQAEGIQHAIDPEGWKERKREQFAFYLRLIDNNPNIYVKYAGLNGSWVGRELSDGSKVLGLSDWPSGENVVVVTEKAGTFGYVSIANFKKLHMQPVAAAV